MVPERAPLQEENMVLCWFPHEDRQQGHYQDVNMPSERSPGRGTNPGHDTGERRVNACGLEEEQLLSKRGGSLGTNFLSANDCNS